MGNMAATTFEAQKTSYYQLQERLNLKPFNFLNEAFHQSTVDLSKQSLRQGSRSTSSTCHFQLISSKPRKCVTILSVIIIPTHRQRELLKGERCLEVTDLQLP